MATVLPENILKRMTPKDRAPLGKAGLTAAECAAKQERQLEKELQDQIRGLLRRFDVLFINPPMHKKSGLPEGWPDFTFSVNKRSYAWEAKTATGKLSPEQKVMLKKLSEPPNGWTTAVIRSYAEASELLQAALLEGRR